MNLFRKRIGMGLVLLAGMLVGGVATATPVTMDFDGLTPFTSVDNYYNGGCTEFLGLDADCGGLGYGVVWKGATVGNGFAGLLFNGNSTMNVVAGVNGGLSLRYYNLTNLIVDANVSVFSGLDGAGTLLASADLGKTKGKWDSLDIAFWGSAQSVVFGGTALFMTRFDDVSFELNAPVHPVPEPAALGVFGLGLLLMGAFAGLRRRYH
jgi:hypothetical protein